MAAQYQRQYGCMMLRDAVFPFVFFVLRAMIGMPGDGPKLEMTPMVTLLDPKMSSRARNTGRWKKVLV